MNSKTWLAAFCGLGLLFAYATVAAPRRAVNETKAPAHYPITKTDAQWRKQLTPAQYHILREKGTEAPGSGKYDQFWGKGTYVCAADGNPLFSSDTKYDPHEGWPSFWAPLSKKNVLNVSDRSLLMERTEVVCAKCGGHLGHLFDDGPKPTGQRYCMDSDALKFIPATPAKK